MVSLDVDNVVGNAEVLHDGKSNGSKGLVDFEALDIADFPTARSSACLTAGTGPRPNMTGSTAPTPQLTNRPIGLTPSCPPTCVPRRERPQPRCSGQVHCLP